MKIAQIAPLYESVPPGLYGGTERIVSYLTEELVRRGHDVTLFASGDSRTSATLVPCCRAGLRLDPAVRDPIAYHIAMLDAVRARAETFDILHFHTDYLHFPLFRDISERTLTTLHGRLDQPELRPVFERFADLPLVSVSGHQRRPMPAVRWEGTVHHGLPRQLLRPGEGDGGYLAFLGRISPEKRPDLAIDIAKRAGISLKIAAKIERTDRDYHETCVAPLLDHPLVEFVGEIGEDRKSEFLGRARALLFPIDWPEPFGLVLIEAMAAGTPVVAFPAGAVPEIVEHELTGLLVGDPAAAAAAVAAAGDLDRRAIRARFEERFSVERMANAYLEIYRRLADGHQVTNLRTIEAGLDTPAPVSVVLE
jgi:glycosyltransferase involved in cell wall biosynthesis